MQHPYSKLLVISVLSLLVLVNINQGQTQLIPRECPAEPVPTAPCPAECTSCSDTGRCIIQEPAEDVYVPDDRPTQVVCGIEGSCDQISIFCSDFASCDVVCGYSSCNAITLVCGQGNHSCSLICASDTYYGEIPLGAFECNNNSACNCANNCPGPYLPCTRGINCLPDDVCFGAEPLICSRDVPSASELMWTSTSGSCGCQCKNPSFQPYDEGGIRYCVDPDRFCNTDRDCNGRGDCLDHNCHCIAGYTGTCNISSCSQPCLNGGLCHHGQCECVSGFSGPSCEVAPSCKAGADLVPPQQCPQGCDYCFNQTCVILKGIGFVDCPHDAASMSCLIYCTDSECDEISCSSSVSCDVVCAGSNCRFVECLDRDVPCRLHCLDSDPTVKNTTIETVSCVSSGAECSLCDYGTCNVQNKCIKGLNCSFDPCEFETCLHGELAVDSFGRCTCNCSASSGRAGRIGGQLGCFTNNSCDCYDEYQQCSNGKCLCSGLTTGSNCKQTLTGCPALPVPATPNQCPDECIHCSFDSQTCLIQSFSPNQHVTCPNGWHCIIDCMADFCANTTFHCPPGTMCDLYCVEQRSCTLTTLNCTTQGPCRSHCSSPDYNVNLQVMKNHLCPPGNSSCECSSTCALHRLTPNPCVDESAPEDDFLKTCPNLPNAYLVPHIDRTNRSNCVCECDSLDLQFDPVLQKCTCPLQCRNDGFCDHGYVDDYDYEGFFFCQCIGGWTGPLCESRCFFPVPVDVVSCQNGVYIIRGAVVIGNTVNILKDTPDVRSVYINGSWVVQTNATLIITQTVNASSSASAVNISITGGFTQSPGSVLVTGGYLTTGGTLVGTRIIVEGDAQLSGELSVQLDPTAIAALQQGSLELDVLFYGRQTGAFTSVTTNVQTLSDGCSKIKSTPVYGATRLSVIFEIDSSSCVGSGSPGSSTVLDLDAAIASSAPWWAVLLGVVGFLVVLGVVAVILVWKIPSLRHKIFPYRAGRVQVESSVDNEVESGWVRSAKPANQ